MEPDAITAEEKLINTNSLSGLMGQAGGVHIYIYIFIQLLQLLNNNTEAATAAALLKVERKNISKTKT